MITAIIIHFRDAAFTANVVAKLRKHCVQRVTRIIVVDNASGEPYTPPEGVELLSLSQNKGYGSACNAGAAAASSEYLLILNNDLDFKEDFTAPMIDAMSADSGIAMTGPKLQFRDGRFQLSFGDHPGITSEFQERRWQQQSRLGEGPNYERRKREAEDIRNVDWLTGAVMLVRKKAFDAVGGFDEDYFFYYEDIDLCTRLRQQDYRLQFHPETTVVHFGGGSDPMSNPDIVVTYRREQLRFYARYNGLPEFLVLKGYLVAKFLMLGLLGKTPSGLTGRLLGEILRFSWSRNNKSKSSS